jgi:glycosyltransferase involved in cell wall biosynthesis
LQAARKLSETSDVVIVGSSGYGGPWDEAASKHAADRPRVKWLGHLRDDELLFALWQNAGVYFHGHSVGGTNPALVQAMACGAPTIARDTVYNREVLADSGRFVEPTSEAIVDATSSLLLDSVEQSRMSNASVARQNDLYTWDGVCQRYESLLLEALQPATKVAK